MKAILRWFVLSVVILGASCATSVRQEQHRLAGTAGTEPAVAEGTADDLLPASPARTGDLLHVGVAVGRAPPVASTRRPADSLWLESAAPPPAPATREVRCGSCAASLDNGQAVVQLPRAGGGPVLAPATEDGDAIPGPWYDWPGTGKVLPGSDGPYGPPTAPREDRHLVSEAWPAGRYPLLVEDTDRYWLVNTAARQIARPDVGPATPEINNSGGTAAVPARQVTAPGEVALPVPNERRLLVDQGAQVMYVHEGGVEVRVLPVSTGMLTSKTLTRAWVGLVGQDLGAATVDGGMRVEQAWYLFPDLFGNILLHTVPYVEQGTLRIYDQPEALGVRPSSHGCVRMSVQDAQWLKEWRPVGVPIEITAPPDPMRQVG